MADSIVSQLRKTIDEKHSEALKALETLKAYFAETPAGVNVQSTGRKQPKKAEKRQPPRAGTGKIRPKVLGLMRDKFVSIKEVAGPTGLTTAQVRGVVLSPALKANFEKKEIDGVMHYRYKGDSD